jgi:hypothetical protein
MADNPLMEISRLLAALPSTDDTSNYQKALATKSRSAFQLKITLRDVTPPVWRRVQTPDCTLAEFHQTIQAVMGWQNCHMHEFHVGDTRVVAREMEEFEETPEGSRLETEVRLSDIYAAGEKRFGYMYDFGDGWEHEIKIEKTLLRNVVGEDPTCTGGARACPPDDVGGPFGYEEFVAALADASHERHAELSEWYGEDFDPARFELEEVNRQLETS